MAVCVRTRPSEARAPLQERRARVSVAVSATLAIGGTAQRRGANDCKAFRLLVRRRPHDHGLFANK
eukprot:7378744-Prymnesium_polylepis.5